MEYQVKPISPGSIQTALDKAETYRFLNEPEEAESICRDVLAIEPESQAALRLLGLAITDQFTGNLRDRSNEAEEIFGKLTDTYKQMYYTGIVRERRARAQLRAGQPARMLIASLEDALNCFAKAQELRPAGNDESILRWNRCVRLLQTLQAGEPEEPAVFEDTDSPPQWRRGRSA